MSKTLQERFALFAASMQENENRILAEEKAKIAKMQAEAAARDDFRKNINLVFDEFAEFGEKHGFSIIRKPEYVTIQHKNSFATFSLDNFDYTRVRIACSISLEHSVRLVFANAISLALVEPSCWSAEVKLLNWSQVTKEIIENKLFEYFEETFKHTAI